MISGTINRREKETSFWNVPRFSGVRADRYIRQEKEEYSMISVLKRMLTEAVSNNYSEETESAAKIAIKQANELGYGEGLLALYKGEYVVVFLNVRGLDHCALKLTHNEEERNLINNFYISSTDNDRILFSLLCLNICREKQRVNLLQGEDTYGVIYSNYPEVDEPISSFMQYININQAITIAQKDAIMAVKKALERGCSEREILNVLPLGVENKFLNAQWTEYEIAQFDALMPNIAQFA